MCNRAYELYTFCLADCKYERFVENSNYTVTFVLHNTQACKKLLPFIKGKISIQHFILEQITVSEREAGNLIFRRRQNQDHLFLLPLKIFSKLKKKGKKMATCAMQEIYELLIFFPGLYTQTVYLLVPL